METETIKKWATKGGKYTLELIRDNYGYSLKSFKNGEPMGSESFGDKPIDEVMKRVKESIYWCGVIDAIVFKEI